MNDDEFTTEWDTLEPTMRQRRRMEARVATWLEAHDTSLISEWMTLFEVAPIRTAGLVAASALSIVAATPIVWIARALL